MPEWMQWLATISPATYALEGIRDAILNGAGVQMGDFIPLLAIGAVSIPLGLAVFKAGERYAKRTGKLKRAG
jgi:ABC-2 type transport system permease protein